MSRIAHPRPAGAAATFLVLAATIALVSGEALAQGIPVPMPALCPGGQNPIATPFFDDMENPGLGNWAISTITGVNLWFYPPPPAATVPWSGVLNIWGRDDANIGDSVIAMTRLVTVPATGARMQFNHAYVFESDGRHHFDGGVIEYSTDNGATWRDAGDLISAGAAYGGPLDVHFGNPLGGRMAFVDDSFGYTATQLNLGSLAGQNVRFRFRIGTDETLEDSGWFIDDVRIYQCAAGVGAPYDFNGDSRSDVLWRHSSGLVSVWLLNATGVVAASLGGVGTDWTIQGVGDFSGDGKADILWRHTSGLVSIWFLNGASLIGSGSPTGVGPDWTVQGVGDFNGDGKADILWRHTSGQMFVWLMNGTAIIGAGSPGGVGPEWKVQDVGDFNGDGNADILWRSTAGLVAIWLMNGTSTMGSGAPAGVGPEWTIQGVGDFNGDNKADVLWRSTSGLVSIWLMNGLTISGAGSPSGVGPEWTIQGVGEFNADGKADVLWRNTSGQLHIWLMNGTAISGSAAPGGAGLDWSVQ